ncbi:serine hydrolase domain-containing protein [Kibdelosporangium phytohabitans]|uniref:Serine hydrolase n=1 Tax=Kibdelosporangium phytohabitans TaxID=860235 RepID=A0A0N9HVP4_9PSEU|nr:serine hydrolase domain-containing protein [Kibdelosporangium phytohabitans]ALG05865.1 serine hydrolase [Kibdelosporangium phytohabitans]MBE1466100.1 CubicO group peptidase (beta-lactamase class C family) [Kibdelosporangium phytohabitans]
MLAEEVDRIAAETGFAGVVSVDRRAEVEFARAYGCAHRGYQVANTLDTRFAIASGTKGLTALAVMSLVVDGVLELDTTARSVLGSDLPLIDDAVTVEHLLGHRSGIGEFYAEEDLDGAELPYTLPVGPHELVNTEDYVEVLDGHPQQFAPDTGFSYCNGGYVVLALITERVTGTPFHTLVRERVCAPAEMTSTEFLRTDEPGPRTAVGYIGERTNVFHLPVRGNGDGGVYSTTSDFTAFWPALFEGAIVPIDRVATMTRSRSEYDEKLHYGLGFWLPVGTGNVMLEGYDAGVSFRSTHQPESGLTYTVVANDSEGAWPITRRLSELLDHSSGSGSGGR